MRVDCACERTLIAGAIVAPSSCAATSDLRELTAINIVSQTGSDLQEGSPRSRASMGAGLPQRSIVGQGRAGEHVRVAEYLFTHHSADRCR